MTHTTNVRAAAARKPKFGTACNGCGLCCLIEPCSLAIEFVTSDTTGPCPALEKEDDRFWCGLLRRPHHYIEELKEKPWVDGPIQEILLASGAFGAGCDSDDLDPSELP